MTPFEWVAIAIVSSVSTARLTRLLTFDTFPPSIWVRMQWDKVTKDGSWSMLAHCGYCFGLWAAAFVLGWGYWCDWSGTWGTLWWLFNGWMAVGYTAAIIMVNDGDDS